ncbi:MAG: DUF421 domain-containing protein [Ruminococcaceae bacterium]|nr:DUF421 domain-containing protein [Oscillospiraceae bacterium]
MSVILFRTLVIYAFLMLTMRFMGKRQLGELELSELITALLLSEVASLPITNQDIPLSHALLPILTLMALEVLLSGLILKLPFLKKLLGVRPAILIHRGKIDRDTLQSIRISTDELISQLRLKDVTDPGDVEYAILEPNGQISVILSSHARPATTKELGLSVKECGIMHLLVSDGQINDKNLQMAGKDRRWLEKYLKDKKTTLEDVFVLMADDGGRVQLHTRKKS